MAKGEKNWLEKICKESEKIMCGIIGYYSEERKRSSIYLLYQLMIESGIRGTHSFGTAYYNGEKLVMKKARNLDPYLIKDWKSNRLIYHCRYATSGDPNSWFDMKNAQPINVDNRTIALNGVISMKTKQEYSKQFNIKCTSDNDAEIILRQKHSTLRFLRRNPQVSYAGVILAPNRIVAIRNNKRPLCMFKKHGAVFIVSTIDIARRAGVSANTVHYIPAFKRVII